MAHSMSPTEEANRRRAIRIVEGLNSGDFSAFFDAPESMQRQFMESYPQVVQPLFAGFRNLTGQQRGALSRVSGIAVGQIRSGVNPGNFPGGSLPDIGANQTAEDTQRDAFASSVDDANTVGGIFQGQEYDPIANRFSDVTLPQNELDAIENIIAQQPNLPAGEAAALRNQLINDATQKLGGRNTQQNLITATGDEITGLGEFEQGRARISGDLLVDQTGALGKLNVGAAEAIERTSAGLGAGITEGFAGRQREGLALLEGLGEVERGDINRRFNARGGAISQNLVRRGLSGTTVGSNLRSGLNLQRDQELSRLNERLQGQQFDAFTGLSSDVLGSRRTDQENITFLGGQTAGVAAVAGGADIAAVQEREAGILGAGTRASERRLGFYGGFAATPPGRQGSEDIKNIFNRGTS